jgi:hypothetical protein
LTSLADSEYGVVAPLNVSVASSARALVAANATNRKALIQIDFRIM